MILVVDIGNTQIKLGVFENQKLIKEVSFLTFEAFKQNIDLLNSYSIDATAISSVVPKLTSITINEIKNYCNDNVLIVTDENCQVKLNIEQPNTVGADRLCNMAAGIYYYNYPLIIIDFGTANTYDVIDSNCAFIGGVISPGVETSARYLIEKAALLDETKFKFPNQVIGKTTKTNIQSGIMFGAIDQITGMINRIKDETVTDNYTIVLTGGFGKLLSPKLNVEHVLDENLTLKGLLHIYNLNA